MELRDLLRRFAFHALLAFSLWLVLLLALEFLIPGFVTPFIDLIDLGIVAVAFLPLGIWVASDEQTPVRRWVSMLFSAMLGAIGLATLWFSFNGAGKLNIGLWVCVFILSLLTIYAVYTRDTSA